jgi:hypothetical protein
MSKYGNRRSVSSDGKVFPSVKECRRYEELVLLKRLGEIDSLETQVKFHLIPKQDGEREVTYTADFTYISKDGKLHVEDAKGFRTQQYVIRRKLMLWIHKIKVEEV